MNALLVKDEALRIEALNQYEVLNSAPDPVLDDITGLAAQLCDTPAQYCTAWFQYAFQSISLRFITHLKGSACLLHVLEGEKAVAGLPLLVRELAVRHGEELFVQVRC